VVIVLDKTFVSDKYDASTNSLTVEFSDGTAHIYDLGGKIPSQLLSFKVQDNYILQLEFDNHEIKYYNMINRLTGIFSFLEDIEEFKKVQLIQNNRAIGWQYQNGIVDFWVDSLYFHSYSTKS